MKIPGDYQLLRCSRSCLAPTIILWFKITLQPDSHVRSEQQNKTLLTPEIPQKNRKFMTCYLLQHDHQSAWICNIPLKTGII